MSRPQVTISARVPDGTGDYGTHYKTLWDRPTTLEDAKQAANGVAFRDATHVFVFVGKRTGRLVYEVQPKVYGLSMREWLDLEVVLASGWYRLKLSDRQYLAHAFAGGFTFKWSAQCQETLSFETESEATNFRDDMVSRFPRLLAHESERVKDAPRELNYV